MEGATLQSRAWLEVAAGANALALSPLLGDVAAALAVPPTTIARAATAYGGATALAALLLAPRIERCRLFEAEDKDAFHVGPIVGKAANSPERLRKADHGALEGNLRA